MVKITHFRHDPAATDIAAGHVLFAEGAADSAMYLILEGEVGLTVQGRLVETVDSGGIVGEIALIDNAPHSSTATALTASRVVPVDREYFVHLVEEHPTFALQVMTIMAERLREARGQFTP
jgi:CRP/FNR family transcriptional regulator, cyclic AMP receptor protein